VIAGRGTERSACATLARDLGIGERVHFPGVVQGAEKVALFRNCLFFLCPSRREPFATVNLEALAGGKAIVATAVGGNPEVVVDGVNGFLAAPGEPDALVPPMLRLLGDPALREAMGRESSRLAPRFDWEGIVGQYVAVFEEARARALRGVARGG
jgi:glycosyltransferase involved in cell wall biosynthesis